MIRAVLAALGAAMVALPGPGGGPAGADTGSRASPVLAGSSAPGGRPVHAEAPPAGHTGGFGEPTCLACHDAYPLNEPGGSLTIEGLPDAYRGGEEYTLTVVLSVPETVRAGFQLSARLADGRQAGRWVSLDRRVSVADSGGVSYARTTLDGTEPQSPEQATWSLSWVAPVAGGAVHFHVAANSGNGDNSPFGDLVYATAVEVQSGRWLRGRVRS